MKGRHHCRKCGKAVCDECSKNNNLQLSQNDPKLYRCCDECAAEIENLDIIASMKDEITEKSIKLDEIELKTKTCQTEQGKYKELTKAHESQILDLDEKINQHLVTFINEKNRLTMHNEEYERTVKDHEESI